MSTKITPQNKHQVIDLVIDLMKDTLPEIRPDRKKLSAHADHVIGSKAHFSAVEMVDGQCVAALVVLCLDNPFGTRKIAQVDLMYVDPRFERQGIADTMWSEFMEWFTGRRAMQFITAAPANDELDGWLINKGFEQRGSVWLKFRR